MSAGQYFGYGLCVTVMLVSLYSMRPRRRRRNKPINLPPPDARCRRNGPEAIP